MQILLGPDSDHSGPGRANRCTAQIKYPGPDTRSRKPNISSPLVFPADPADFTSSEFFRPAHIFDVAPVPHHFSNFSSCCLACSHSRACHICASTPTLPFPHSLTNGRFSLSDLFSHASRPDQPAHWRTAHQPDRPRAFVSQARWAGMIPAASHVCPPLSFWPRTHGERLLSSLPGSMPSSLRPSHDSPPPDGGLIPQLIPDGLSAVHRQIKRVCSKESKPI